MRKLIEKIFLKDARKIIRIFVMKMAQNGRKRDRAGVDCG